MLTRLRVRLTYANVTATLALFVALGGSSYAALSLPKGSVGGKQLRKNAVTSPKVKPGSLLVNDFKRSQRARLLGPQGPAGTQGPKGDQGAPGATNVVVRRVSYATLAGGSFRSVAAMCQTGERAVGGGAGFTGNGGNEIVQQSYPIKEGEVPAQEGDTPTGWKSFIKNANAFDMPEPTAYVVCARP